MPKKYTQKKKQKKNNKTITPPQGAKPKFKY
jgi:hypothetical protein